MSPAGLGTKNNFAGEGQQQFSSQSVMRAQINLQLENIIVFSFCKYILIFINVYGFFAAAVALDYFRKKS
jgi:hypothetical protein